MSQIETTPKDNATAAPELLSLIDRGETPPGQYRYTQPETGRTFSALTGNHLFSLVGEHRKAMHISLETMRQDILQQLCPKIPGWCKGGAQEEPKSQAGKIGFKEALAGTATLVDFFMHGRKRVEASEAERRASICVGCQKNVPLADCSTCNSQEIRDIITKVVEGGKTSADSKLHVCAVCSCSNQAAVWMRLSELQPYISEAVNDALPDFCWKKKIALTEEDFLAAEPPAVKKSVKTKPKGKAAKGAEGK